VCLEFEESVNRLVLGHHMLFPRKLSVQMSSNFRSEDILFKKVLFAKLLQVLPEDPAMDGLVSLIFMVRAVFL